MNQFRATKKQQPEGAAAANHCCMAAKAGVNHADLWSEIIASDGQETQLQPRVQAIFQRRKPDKSTKETVPSVTKLKESVNGVRVSIADPPKRVSWNRSLSTRGRESIAVVACVRDQPGQKQVRRKLRPAIPKPKAVQPPTFEKEIAYFKEVDAFELIEESPSPKSSTWVSGQTDSADIPQLTSRLEKWLITKKLNYCCEPSSTLTKILETPATIPESISETPTMSCQINVGDHSVLKSFTSMTNNEYIFKLLKSKEHYKDVQVEDLDSTIRKLSLTSTCSTLESDHVDPFAALLAVCGQSSPSKLLDVFAKYCDPGHITKIGEGTFGEAFKAGNYVCKIVPIDGDFRVNGEVQKRSEELLEEAILSCTLNQLRTSNADACNRCTTFIETIELKVCQGSYDAALVKAWEEWDEKNGSENDHPQQFPEKQFYVIFVLEHGGKDLESFVLLNSNEAQSLLLQVTAALAVAETAYEFEHRDLHWGNILLSRNESTEMSFTLDGEPMKIKTFGLCISIIDFTLSRINTGKDILFLDLSTDPDLFKEVKGNKQSETYRKMKVVTGDCWEESFPRTNVLWLQYLVDILLSKKSFERSSKKDRDFRSLKKRLDNYSSTKQALSDPFFSDLFLSCVER